MSANHEIWTVGTSDGEGAGLLAGLRDYLNSLVALLPIADPLRGSVDAFFDEEAAWVTGLPPVSGLATAPSERSLLDQIADYATGAIQSISVLAPYFDEGGAALSERASPRTPARDRPASY